MNAPVQTSQPILSLQSITKRYKGLTAINQVSIDIEPGTVTSIVGPNGAGKSTLFNLISGYVQPSEGRVLFQGQDITGKPTYAIAQLGIARAFQIAKPFPELSVQRNIHVGALFGRTGPRDPQALTEHALDICRLGPWRDAAASTLSVGNLRRLELARAIAARPALLLADEPCAGLNETETGEIIEVIAQICTTGITVVLVEHDIKAVRRVSKRVVVIEAGRTIADGTAETVFSDPAVITAYLGTTAT
ncbi:ABC transporter ATP-binding protein [Bordetella sp. BOR01]|uniref:ABC transporter ATP-binding protein n=1 Tax=Bordetella sp. BOR01 TaxID=2854779 RepID=UPI001C48D45E|nr:ABC transporter ATP-binding protein [Bordetella sp. BOR01]MBV7483831.1 ABC transporter ATP-binding protein [Bordetella sp. BOR01]